MQPIDETLKKCGFVALLAAVCIAPVEALGQMPNWQQAIQQNQQQGQQLNQQSKDPDIVARGLVPEITGVPLIRGSYRSSPQSESFGLRVEWTENAEIVNRMESLGYPRDGYCIESSAKLLDTSEPVGYMNNGTPLYGTFPDPQIDSSCHDSEDRSKEFDVPGNTNTVKVKVRARFGSIYSKWSALSGADYPHVLAR